MHTGIVAVLKLALLVTLACSSPCPCIHPRPRPPPPPPPHPHPRLPPDTRSACPPRSKHGATPKSAQHASLYSPNSATACLCCSDRQAIVGSLFSSVQALSVLPPLARLYALKMRTCTPHSRRSSVRVWLRALRPEPDYSPNLTSNTHPQARGRLRMRRSCVSATNCASSTLTATSPK